LTASGNSSRDEYKDRLPPVWRQPVYLQRCERILGVHQGSRVARRGVKGLGKESLHIEEDGVAKQ
jgi:hypothetical protein